MHIEGRLKKFMIHDLLTFLPELVAQMGISSSDVSIQRFCHDAISRHCKYPPYDTPQYTTIQTIIEVANYMVSFAVCAVCSRIEKENIQSMCSHGKTYQADPGLILIKCISIT